MPAKTPAGRGDTGFPGTGYYTSGGGLGVGEDHLSDGTHLAGRANLIWEPYYFADIDDGDTWDNPPKGTRVCAWQGDARAGDACNAYLRSGGDIQFETASTSDVNGWLWVGRSTG